MCFRPAISLYSNCYNALVINHLIGRIMTDFDSCFGHTAWHESLFIVTHPNSQLYNKTDV
jgi:hypothetical protein